MHICNLKGAGEEPKTFLESQGWQRSVPLLGTELSHMYCGHRYRKSHQQEARGTETQSNPQRAGGPPPRPNQQVYPPDCCTGFSQSCQVLQFLHLDPAKTNIKQPPPPKETHQRVQRQKQRERKKKLVRLWAPFLPNALPLTPYQ